jgi:ribosome biogenesis GTPase
MASATVLRASGGVYDVELADGTVAEASLRGRLKLEQRTGDRVVPGDIVDVTRQSDGSLTIEAVAARRSELARRAPGHGRRAKVIVANVDRVAVVFAAARPAPSRRLLDRFLVVAEANRLQPVIVLNKIDMVAGDVVAALLAPYEAAGYATIRTSALTGAGVDELRCCLAGRRSVVTGPSGAGKSSLLNAVQPGLGLRVGAVGSAVVREGRHTTVTARLIPLAAGGYVADTPGLRELGLWGIDPETLPHCFPEFVAVAASCRFSSCSHVHEPACAVRAAVTAGGIDSERYASYCALREETVEAPKW